VEIKTAEVISIESAERQEERVLVLMLAVEG
jgi:hypothetical protein